MNMAMVPLGTNTLVNPDLPGGRLGDKSPPAEVSGLAGRVRDSRGSGAVPGRRAQVQLLRQAGYLGEVGVSQKPQSFTEAFLLPVPVAGRHLVSGQDAYLQRGNHKSTVAGAAPPSSEGMKSLSAVNLRASAPGARFDLVWDFIDPIFWGRIFWL